ncbi:MAG: ABC transporter ATP-binding protein [Clostridia bacterium]|nr:ABC transporter ATP-binding protein [Clostridia bacterium]MBQ5612978.1 ABC transporter ATP-binding protein [Clostridia bacterium]MBQ5662469.1 ABC transporter ATP-binding protein [Clostridia bacterium]MBQ5772407.1 ABC transporter ATP-binding protein [Clostridia bacterium]
MPKDKIQSMKEYLVALARGRLRYNSFFALSDVSFSVGRGEVLGIVGSNGAGKSTLLKVIAGILTPTSGELRVKGRVVPMLELGSGFDDDLTGRENIFLNGAILGYSEQFLRERFDEIVEFSGLYDFLDVPVRNYSSGMVMRLAFSIASMVEPDVLIVDEILAVGDARFQEKSYTRMLELMHRGTTVLLVSHDLGQIRRLCDRVLWLDGGRVRRIGDTQEVCDAYAKASSGK